MKIASVRRIAGVGFNMTPMIDVVFLLIIFFLVSSHLAKQETQLELPLPMASSGQASRDDATPRVTINVLADGQLRLVGRVVTDAQLAPRLAGLRQAEGDLLQVRIRCDRNVPYAYVEPILRACAQAGIWDVSFAVFRREDVPQ